MNYLQKTQIIFTELGFCSSTAIAANTDQNQNRGRHQGPPPEAYTACEGKAIGDTAQFVNPGSKEVYGTCEQEGSGRGSGGGSKSGSKLVLRPDRSR